MFFEKGSKGSPLCLRFLGKFQRVPSLLMFLKKFQNQIIKGGGEYWLFLPSPSIWRGGHDPWPPPLNAPLLENVMNLWVKFGWIFQNAGHFSFRKTFKGYVVPLSRTNIRTNRSEIRNSVVSHSNGCKDIINMFGGELKIFHGFSSLCWTQWDVFLQRNAIASAIWKRKRE